MRALVVDEKGGLALREDAPKPQPAGGEALIRVILAGICRTDQELVGGYKGFRGVLGHEFIGVVEAVADGASDLVGSRVVGEINHGCGRCDTCLKGEGGHCAQRRVLGIHGWDGALADYCVMPVENLHRVPSGVRDEQAVFVEPLAAALEILDRIHLRPSDKVTVIGDGKLGGLIVRVLRLSGCQLQVVGRHTHKLQTLAPLGVDVLMAEEAEDLPPSDVVVECSGSASGLTLAQKLVQPRGKIILKSTFRALSEISFTDLVVGEVTLAGSRCGPFAPALRLLAQGLVAVDSLIEEVYGLDQGLAAFKKAGKKGALKVLVKP
ncbi:MAG: alcohol dehydrogenase catalytic domain-containing protein [Magnetococcales bacterium]|nr:alcohol dehydrogenase catalytic domain-containing protein [Magnetococcales bacterium]